jgi:hypothetical protein
MAGKDKPPAANSPVFSAAKWASLLEVLNRAAAALGSIDLAERDLPEDLLSGRLLTAMRRISPDGGVDTFERLDPSFWEGAQISGPLGEDDPDVWVSGLDTKLTTSFYLYFFVARSNLDKLYPVDRAAEPASDAQAEASGAPTRRKPGPRTKKSWKMRVAAELHRIVIIEGKLPPTAKDLAEFCVRKLNHHPEITEIQKLIKDLL